MDCNAVFTIDFGSEPLAKKALGVLGGALSETKRARVERSVNKGLLKVVIKAKDFTALRAMATSTMRDSKVFFDAVNLTGKKNAK